MKHCVLSSKDFLGGPLNPSHRWDTAMAFTIHEALTGEHVGAGDFSEHFTTRPNYLAWRNAFLKIKDPMVAVNKVLTQLGFKDVIEHGKVDPRMIAGAKKIVGRLTAQLTKEIARERRLADGRIKRLQKLT